MGPKECLHTFVADEKVAKATGLKCERRWSGSRSIGREGRGQFCTWSRNATQLVTDYERLACVWVDCGCLPYLITGIQPLSDTPVPYRIPRAHRRFGSEGQASSLSPDDGLVLDDSLLGRPLPVFAIPANIYIFATLLEYTVHYIRPSTDRHLPRLEALPLSA